MTGSFNLTHWGKDPLIIHDASIANQYLQEFAARYRAAGGNASFWTAVEEKPNPSLPSALELFPNHPNPFNPETWIRYTLDRPCWVSLKILDVTGRIIRTMDRGLEPGGTHTVFWNASGLPSGVYVIEMEARNVESGSRLLFRAVRKMVLQK